MVDLSLRCACGRMRGVAREMTPATTNRVVCHCRGCTRYAHALGRAAEILDEGEPPAGVGLGALLSMLAHYAPLFVGWLIRADARASPFLDPSTRAPRCLPRPPEPPDGGT